ncbi:MAG: cytochrome c oxidase subunit II [Pseudomonadota bacterium]|nr:cytochrome c oxidase subunit II [Pseudomonadota bacterium]
MRSACAPLAAVLAGPLAGCAGVQSAWSPEGPSARAVVTLGNVMFIGAGLILALVIGLTAVAILAPPERRRWLAGQRAVFWLGVVFPVVTLASLLVYGLNVVGILVRPSEKPALTIEVSGERWWWRVNYLDDAGGADFYTANEIHIPVGQEVEFRLSSPDVIHSFWVPTLGGKLDMIPGRVNSFRLQADKAGIYRGQCAEYCGQQHALMAFDLVAVEPDRFDAWREKQRQPAAEPQTALLRQGRNLFISQGCGACHVVRGTQAAGMLGPDLTHVGSRRMIAAGTLANNAGTLGGWISSSQHLKPGNLMPSFSALDGVELRAIAAYLDSLK